MRKLFYVLASGLLGLIVTTIMHAVIELWAIDLIFGNPERFFDTFWWQNWEIIHAVGAVSLWLVGLVGGIMAGVYWYPRYGIPGLAPFWRR